MRRSALLLVLLLVLGQTGHAAQEIAGTLTGVIEGSLSSLRKDPDFTSLGTDGMRIKAVREILSLMLMSMAREPEVVSQVIQTAPVNLDGTASDLSQAILAEIRTLTAPSSRSFHQAIRETASTFDLWSQGNPGRSMRELLGLPATRQPVADRSLPGMRPASQSRRVAQKLREIPVTTGRPVPPPAFEKPAPGAGMTLEDIAGLVLQEVEPVR